MGFLRLWLAVMVLASHCNMLLYSGVLAVECFFAISGFYMQMIILENYSHQPHWVRKFYESRFLRIYVPYWIIVAAILLLSPWAASRGLPSAHMLGSWQSIALNLGIVGTDYAKLMRSTAMGHNSHLFDNLLVPVVWSVGMELLFYLLAPLLLTRLWAIIGVTIASLACKAMFLLQYAPQFPNLMFWDAFLNGIFPCEIGIFTSGALMYRLYARWRRTTANEQKVSRYYPSVILLICSFILLFRYIFHLPDLQMIMGYYGFLILLIALIPVFFAISRNNRFDRSIGELSYSVYLSHKYLLDWVLQLGMNRTWSFVLALVATLAVAYIIVRWIETPLTSFRHRRFRT